MFNNKLLKAALLALVAGPLAQAQPSKMPPVSSDPLTASALAEQITRLTPPAAKPTVQRQRLVGFAYRPIGQVYPSDSFRVWYSGTNGSSAMYNGTPTDYYTILGYDYGDTDRFYARTDYPRADSVLHIKIGYPQTRNYFTYNADGNMLSYERRYAAGSYRCSRYVRTYGTGSNVATVVGSLSPATQCGAYAFNNRQTYTAGGLLLTDSTSYARLRYYYNAANKPDSILVTYTPATSNGSFNVKYRKFAYTYDGSGNQIRQLQTYHDSLRTKLDTLYQAQAWYDALGRADSVAGANKPYNRFKNYFKYTGSFPRPIDEQMLYSFYNGTPQYVINSRMSYHLNAVGNWDTMYYYSVYNGTATLLERDPVLYNADGSMDQQQGYKYNPQNGTYDTAPYDINQYYYEAYDDTPQAGVASVATPEAGAYPNPFRETLQLRAAGPWRLTDLAGRTLAAGTGPAAVATAGWPAGLYLLQTAQGGTKLVKD